MVVRDVARIMTRSGTVGSVQNSEVLFGSETGVAPAAPLLSSPLLSSQSRFAQRLRRRYADQLNLLPQGLPTRAAMAEAFAALHAQGNDSAAALRILRQLVMERLLHLDCDAQAPQSSGSWAWASSVRANSMCPATST
jgi:hypothetical protein